MGSNKPGVDEKRVFSLKEIPRVYGGSPWYWRSRLWDGSIPFIKLGNAYHVRVESIEEFLKENEVKFKG